jgi:hypothetical protein
VEAYDNAALYELTAWKKKMQRNPSFTGRMARNLQVKINKAIPEKIHIAITSAIRNMTRAVSFGAEFTTPKPLEDATLEERELKVRERIKFYSNTAAAEGAITGAGGILLGLADFPLWLILKMKMLFEIAALYGFNVGNYKERIHLLHIFELTFSSQQNRQRVFKVLEGWDEYQQQLPDDIRQFDWRSFQQEYRDYIDIAKLLQLIPGIGAAVGALVNHRLTNKLGTMAMNAFRMRILENKKIAGHSENNPALT